MFDCLGLERILSLQCPHARLQPRRIERVDGERPMTALRASRPARQPLSRAPRSLGQCRIHNLHELRIARWQPHAPSIAQIATPPRSPLIPSHPAPCYNGFEVTLLYLERIPAAPLNQHIRSLWYAQGGFTPFANDSAHLFSNQSVALFDIWGSQANSLRDQLRDLPTPQARLFCFEQFLRGHFAAEIARRNATGSAEVNFALRQFERVPNIASVRETARQIGWSERRFSQVFREAVGLTPKVWCRIQRFQRAVHQLHSGADIHWAELALDCGYYDQSHFANEFRAFSGVDATTYSANRTRWANHIAAE